MNTLTISRKQIEIIKSELFNGWTSDLASLLGWRYKKKILWRLITPFYAVHKSGASAEYFEGKDRVKLTYHDSSLTKNDLNLLVEQAIKLLLKDEFHSS